MKITRILVFFLLPFACAFHVSAEGLSESPLRLNVANAGLALTGSLASLDSKFPYTKKIEQKLSRQLVNQSAKIVPLHYNLITDGLVDTRLGDTLSIALVIDKESIIHRNIAGLNQVVVDIIATAIVFDFDEEEKAVIASFPVPSYPCIETFEDGRPTEQKIQQLVNQYYFQGVCGESQGLLENYLELIKATNIQQKYEGEVGVGDVSVNSEALERMPENFQKKPSLVKDYLASSLSRSLSYYKQLSIIPYQADHSVTTLSLRFTGSSDTILLTLPEPDYLFDVDLQALANKLVKRNSAGASYVYAARIGITLRDTFVDEEMPVFNHSLKYGVAVRTASSQSIFDEWEAYDSAISGLLREFSRNIHRPDKKWLKDQRMDKQDRRQLSEMDSALSELSF